MGFFEAIKNFYRRFVDFKTRSSRSEFWWVYLFFALVFWIPVFSFTGANARGEPASQGLTLYVGISTLFFLANLIGIIALNVRRLHDRNLTGWLYLPYVVLLFVPGVNLVCVIALVVLFVMPGTYGTNKYGDDPLENPIDVFD